MTLSLCLLITSSLGYLAAGYGISRGVFVEKRKTFPTWRRILWIAFALHTLGLLAYSITSGHLPVQNLKETFAPLAWAMMFLYLALGERWSIEVTGAVAAPATFAMTAFSAFAIWHDPSVTPMGPRLYLHILSLIMGYASLFLAAFCAVLYFVQAKLLKEKKLDGIYRALPPLGTLDKVCYRLIWAGFPALVVGIASGVLIQGSHWQWGTQEIMVVATGLVYTIYLHARVAGWQGKQLNVMLLVASVCAAVSFLLPGGHQ